MERRSFSLSSAENNKRKRHLRSRTRCDKNEAEEKREMPSTGAGVDKIARLKCGRETRIRQPKFNLVARRY